MDSQQCYSSLTDHSVHIHTLDLLLKGFTVLIVYLEPFQAQQHTLLSSWQAYVNYWPRSYAYTELYNSAIPTDYWLLFNNVMYADMWLIRYPEQSRVIRTLFDS